MLKTVISFVLYELWHLHTTIFSASREKAQHKNWFSARDVYEKCKVRWAETFWECTQMSADNNKSVLVFLITSNTMVGRKIPIF